jgi:hypothetical protein
LLVQVTSGPQESLQLAWLRQVPQRRTLLEEQIEEVSALTERRLIFVVLREWSRGLPRDRWDVKAREASEEHLAKFEEVCESAAALHLSKRVSAHNRVLVMLRETTLNGDWLTHVELDLTVVWRSIDGLSPIR